MTTTTKTSKNNWFYEQNNSSARASRFLVHFLDVHCLTMTWNLLMRRFTKDVNIRRIIFFLFLNLNKVLKNSIPGELAYISHTERVQIYAIKFAKTQINLFYDRSSLLKLPIKCYLTATAQPSVCALNNLAVLVSRFHISNKWNDPLPQTFESLVQHSKQWVLHKATW